MYWSNLTFVDLEGDSIVNQSTSVQSLNSEYYGSITIIPNETAISPITIDVKTD